MTSTIISPIKDDTINTSEWRPIPDLPYEASTSGQIRRLRDGRVAPQFRSGSYGYPHVSINRDGWHRNFTVHELVSRAFHGQRPPKYDIDHIDGDPTNNTPRNLEYVSHLENMRRSKRYRKGEAHHNSRLTDAQVLEIRRLEATGTAGDLRILMKRFAIERKTLYNVRKGVTWRHLYP